VVHKDKSLWDLLVLRIILIQSSWTTHKPMDDP